MTENAPDIMTSHGILQSASVGMKILGNCDLCRICTELYTTASLHLWNVVFDEVDAIAAAK
jgi:hypothetical protein